MSSSKKRRYNDDPDEREYYIASPSYNFKGATNQHRYQVNQSILFEEIGKQTEFIFAEATAPCVLSNLYFDFVVQYDANQHRSGGIFDNVTRPRLSWAIVTHPDGNPGKLSHIIGNHDFYLPEQRLWKGGMLHLRPNYQTYTYTYPQFTPPEAQQVKGIFDEQLINTELVQATVPPADITGLVSFPNFTLDFQHLRMFTRSDLTITADYKNESIKGYSGLTKQFKHNDKLSIIFQANFLPKDDTPQNRLYLTGTIFFDETIF